MADLDKLAAQLNNLKDLDVNQLAKVLTEHQNNLIKVVLIAGSLFLVWGMFNDHHAKDVKLRAQLAQEQQKLEALKAHDAALKDLNDFKSSIPKNLNEFELTVLLSNYAKLYNVAIPSLSPGESKDMGLYDVININFNAVSDNFKDMMLFLRQIEKSEFPLRINSWSGDEEKNGEITFEINISAVFIHT